MKKTSLISILFIIIYSSCSSKLKTTITGTWTAEECYINGENVMQNMYSNIYHFDKEGICGMPIFNFENKKEKGKWSLLIDEDTLVNVQFKKSPLNGKLKVRFERNYEKKLLFMILENDSIYIKGAKMFHNFETGKTGVFQ